MQNKTVDAEAIRRRLDNLTRISSHEVQRTSHHFLILSELNAWIQEVGVSYAKGKLLDYGCGARPYENLFSKVTSEYVGG
jgi:hypothetical protein